ncbi:MAG: DNA gyrase/topoisomerase IV subunit A [Candidatus Limisoma sp.]|nr:DNA gyrase/topoisomerase IV subunit A [Bacteroidales bacterium]MDY5893440.1 DNA gyrase/topoisomerase IV subunit A [Candidatus Limisoma sp.]
MKDEIDNIDDLTTDDGEVSAHSSYVVPTDKNTHLSGMYQNWYLDYASYVILERAVPHISDGLKPVQRRILHSMKELDDGRFNKVANVVGNTMKYHPHGDRSIGDALVQLGQKDLLIECQGNWGNILTGDDAAAPRYIEARLSEFALETVFNPKTTEWTLSYDGRKPEPVTLPIKFPLLLAQGAEGIAVGLSSKILPHNFNEILDAAVAYLRGEDFALFPDFPTGGFIDVSKYNDGERGGSVRIRSKIEKIDNKTLEITDIPYGKTTGTLIDSIIKAQEKGKIKIRKVDDNTAERADIIVHLVPGTSSDKTIDALYAFTDCEISISPNCCVISDKKPHFLTVSAVLRNSVDTTKSLLESELKIQRAELSESLLFASLEKIFIEERIYKDKEYEQSKNEDDAIKHITKRLKPFAESFVRAITRDDVAKLLDVKMRRIIKFNSEKADAYIKSLNDKLAEIDNNLAHLVEYTIDWYLHLKEKYGHEHPRKTIIRNFDNIVASKVAEANEKLYINREDGFIGTGMKKDEFVCNCSDIDDIIIFFKDGKYKIVKVADKVYVGKNILYLNVFKRNDLRTIYNLVYQDGKGGPVLMKRFAVTSLTRDREYDMTRGTKGSKIWWFSANPNGEAEILRVTLKEKPRLKKLQFDVDFADIAVKGKGAIGNLVTRNDVHRISLKERGTSTLGGREVWFDPDVLRLNYDGRGFSLGEFFGNDLVLVVLKNGQFYTSTFDATNHYEDNILFIEKFRPKVVWTAVLNDADQGYPYIKRFAFEATAKKQSFIGENADSQLLLISDKKYPRFRVVFGGVDEFREPLVVDAVDYIGEKSYKAKGKRLTTYTVGNIEEIEPREVPEEEVEAVPEVDIEPAKVVKSDDIINQNDVRDELTGQMRLFEDEI